MYSIDVSLTASQANKLARSLPIQLKNNQVSGSVHSIVVDEETAKRHAKATRLNKGMRIHLKNQEHIEASMIHGRGFKSMLRKAGKFLKPHLKKLGHALLTEGASQLKGLASQQAMKMGLTNDLQDLGLSGLSGLENLGHKGIEGLGIGRFFKKVGKTLKPVGKAIAPIASQVGKEVLKQGVPILTNALITGAMGGQVRRRRGRGFGQVMKGIGRVALPVGKVLFKDALPIAANLAVKSMLGGGKGSVAMKEKMARLRARKSGSGLYPAGYS